MTATHWFLHFWRVTCAIRIRLPELQRLRVRFSLIPSSSLFHRIGSRMHFQISPVGNAFSRRQSLSDTSLDPTLSVRSLSFYIFFIPNSLPFSEVKSGKACEMGKIRKEHAHFKANTVVSACRTTKTYKKRVHFIDLKEF